MLDFWDSTCQENGGNLHNIPSSHALILEQLRTKFHWLVFHIRNNDHTRDDEDLVSVFQPSHDRLATMWPVMNPAMNITANGPDRSTIQPQR